jgi:F-type H+-transporting ATPase subunit gamma
MSSAKEIRTKIKSVLNTRKITRAMEMVAASKMRKAQDRMISSRPYAKYIREVIAHLTKARPEYVHKYLKEREVKRVAFIVISTDRGLCGGLNVNLFKSVVNEMSDLHDKNVDIDLCMIGSKGEGFFKRLKANILAATGHLGDAPSVTDLVGAVQVLLQAYEDGQVDRIYLAHNNFVNTMVQKPTITQLLPRPAVEVEEVTTNHSWDYLYEPDAKELIDTLVTRYIESQVYQGVVENIACEQAARMVAMKAASDNAGELIDQLKLAYNKARQSAITQELSEIIGGAAAV